MRKRFPGILMFAVLIAFGVSVFAGEGTGYGPAGQQYIKNRSNQSQGSRKMRNLSKDDIRKINEERDTLFKSTEKLRLDIYLKEIELNNELAKKRERYRKSFDATEGNLRF